MCKEKRKVPKLRFPGFTEDWEQRKFSEITYLSGIKNKENKPYESYSISNEFGFIPQNEQFEHGGTMKTADKSMYYIVTQNSFAYNPARINVGSIGYYDKPDNVIVSSLYEVFKTTEIVNDKFLWHWFKSNQFNHLIEKYQEGGVRLYFYYDKLCKGAIELPTIDEQNKISNLLNGLDLFITLHQRKLEHLNLKKKALLQKLFPKNGECYPELCFPGFTDAWEQRKLGELTISIGDGLHGTPKYDENGSYYFINGNNLVDSKVSVTEETKKVAFEALSNDDRRLDSTSILMSINGTIGTLARYNNENIMLGKSVAYITPKNINRDFLFYQLQGDVIQSYFYKNLTGTTIKNLGLGTIKNAIVMSTLSEEEFKIGQLFYKLDQYITLHQRKLDHLQLQKKALLQQMFV